ncbi:MAG: tryptophan 7-halogenase [Chloroflexota bacterium]
MDYPTMKTKADNQIAPAQSNYDVVICGGGLAGQTLGRQLKLTLPQLSILILEKGLFPKPHALATVGESTIETSSFYLGDVLQLRDHLEDDHLRKFGLRFLWTDEEACLADQPEIGLSNFASFISYQIDRGKLENHLYVENQAMGIEQKTGVSVQDIDLNTGDTLHQVRYQVSDHSDVEHTVTTRWVIDAMGRRRYIHKKLNNLLPSKRVHSSAWFHIEGLLDIADIVPDAQQHWHQRVPSSKRLYATNHLMGDGYWVWIIPLSSNYTSIGIVASEPFHEIADFSTLETAMDWLYDMEPVLYEHLQKYPVADFGAIRDFTFSAKQVFSHDRWACTGDSALFSDPFYAPGMAMVSYQNTMITTMIELDHEGQLNEGLVQQYDAFVRGVNEYDTYLIQTPYDYFEHPHIFSFRFLWAFALATGLTYPQAFNQLYLYPDMNEQMRQIVGHVAGWAFRLEFFFKDWAARTQNRFSFQFIDYLSLDFLRTLYDQNTKPYDDFATVLENFKFAVDTLEEFVQIIFLFAVRDVMPEEESKFPTPLWINPQAISLNPARWAQDGLFQTKSTPRDLSEMQTQIESLYIFDEQPA